MTKDEALKLALEYIETNAHERRHVRWAIKEALAQPVQEPVACGNCNGSGRMVRDPDIGTDQECFVCDGAGVPAAQPPQEPVAKYSDIVSDGGLDPRNKFDLPAQRPWAGLTDDEKGELWSGKNGCIPFSYADAIEARLKDKNT